MLVTAAGAVAHTLLQRVRQLRRSIRYSYSSLLVTPYLGCAMAAPSPSIDAAVMLAAPVALFALCGMLSQYHCTSTHRLAILCRYVPATHTMGQRPTAGDIPIWAQERCRAFTSSFSPTYPQLNQEGDPGHPGASRPHAAGVMATAHAGEHCLGLP